MINGIFICNHFMVAYWKFRNWNYDDNLLVHSEWICDSLRICHLLRHQIHTMLNNVHHYLMSRECNLINTSLLGMELVRTCNYANILRETSSMPLELVSRIWMTSFCKSICHHRWCIKSYQIRSIPYGSVTLPIQTDCHCHLNKIRMTHKIMNLMNNKYSFSNLDVVEIQLAAF